MTRALALALALVSGFANAPVWADGSPPPGIDVRVAPRLEVTQGQTSPLEITLAVDRGLTVSKDAAVIVDLVPPAGVHLKKRRLGRAEAVDPGADAPRYAVAVRGDAAGEYLLPVRIRLWLCGGKVCRPVDVRREATVVVAAAPAPPLDAPAAPARTP